MKFKSKFLSTISLLSIFSQIYAFRPNLLGKKAPEFKAQAVFADGSTGTFNLKNFAGKKIVLYFYPMDRTIGCTKQAQNFRDGIAKLEKQNITLVGISCDSVHSHKRFQEIHKLPYILVSDSRWHRTIAKLYGTVSFFISKRKTFLIDEKGIVFKIFDKVNIETQIDDILTAFEKKS